MSAVVVVQPPESNLVISYQSLGTADLLLFKMMEEYQSLSLLLSFGCVVFCW